MTDGHIEIYRTFNQFHALQLELRNEGYFGLPTLPDKTILPMSNKTNLDKRRRELEAYL